MSVDRTYVNGIIAVKEKFLLGNRIPKMCEGSAEDAFRILTESGFAKGAELASVYDYERALVADEKDTDAFIRAYSPSKAATEYLFAPRDYHNAKALLKAWHLKSDPAKLLAPDGIYSAGAIKAYVENGAGDIDGELKKAIDEGKKHLEEEGANASGAELGIIFERALTAHLIRACKLDKLLKKFLIKRADMTDVLTVMRSGSAEHAEGNLLLAGKLKKEQLLSVFADEEKAEKALDGTPLKDFWRGCLAVRKKGLPQTEAERTLAGFEEQFLSENKYNLSGSLPFLYYVFKRRAENQNVRIVLSCLIAGMDAESIKRRLRSFN